jgi:hypothetical protein
MDGEDSVPILDHTPKPFGVPTMREKVCCSLLGLLAKWAKSTILPSSPFEAVRRPNPIRDCEPHEELDLGSCPNLPHHLVEACKRGTKKLCVISGGR